MDGPSRGDPCQSQPPPKPSSSALIDRHQLARIELIATGREIIARAYPAPYARIIDERYQKALQGRTGSITVAEATDLRQKAVDEPLARAQAPTIAEAIWALAEQLKPG